MINITLLITSFLAGLLTVIAPCVLPLLPIIVGGSLVDQQRWRPLIIAVSLALSVMIFTLLLKVFTLFINVPQEFWTNLSAIIIVLFGLVLLFPNVWDWISSKLHFSQTSENLLQKASTKSSIWGAILLGASLGPVFSSCSPTYFVILATILPVNLFLGCVYLLAYAVGLALILWLIALLGRRLTSRLKFAANPQGWFKRSLGILLIVVGLAIGFGIDKQIESELLSRGLGSTSIERHLLLHASLHDNSDPTTKPTSTAPAVDVNTHSSITVSKIKAPTLDWSDNNAGVLAYYGAAPELVGLTGWINSPPLTLASLRGKVVLLDFWTYSCINCLRTLPYIEAWSKKYAPDGLVIIGLSDPEFQFEKKYENVLAAVRKNGLTYPIALDNDHQTWDAYHNEYWPAKYLIDRDGNLRYFHFGEGDYDKTEKIIQNLLDVKDQTIVANQVKAPTAGSIFLTAETYLGNYRRNSLVSWNSDLANGQWAINNFWVTAHPIR